MKKLVILAAGLLIGTASFAKKTANGTELGARFSGETYGLGLGLDMAFASGSANRIHADLGVAGGGIYGNCLYDWLFPIPELPALVFYPGVGGGAWIGDGVNASVVGEAGLEFRFDFPMTLGIDVRPRFDLLNDPGFRGGASLVVRYRL